MAYWTWQLLALVGISGCADSSGSVVDPLPHAKAPSRRSFEPVTWDTVFRFGNDAEDSSLQIPRLVAAGRDRVIVFDYGDLAIKAFDFSGASLWRFGRQGSGPGEFRGAFDLDISSDGTVWLLDPNLNRVTVLKSDGRFERVMHPQSELLASIVPRGHDAIVLTALIDPFWLRVNPQGAVLASGTLSFPELAAVPHFVRQPLGTGAGQGVWAVAFPYGNLLLVYDGDRLRCAGKTVEGSGFPTAPAPDLPIWVAGVTIAGTSVALLANGQSRDRLRVLDFYSLEDCRYLRSLRLPRRVSAVAHTEGVYVLQYDDPAPALLGLRPTTPSAR